jgi:acyl dehydratase/catechol 2,3-dioxygenase-like lactoylglutathione lyase family enzyme
VSGPLRYWEELELGRVYPIGVYDFTEEAIVEFGRQFDPQPFHIDREAAKVSMFGGLIASGWHICSAMMRLLVDNFSHPEASMGGAGLHDICWHRPVRPGDRLTASVRIVEKKPLSSRADVGLVFKDYEAFNQHGELALTMQGREFIRRNPSGAGESAMAEAVKGIDHVVVVVKDIDQAETAWKRLGFAVQPRGFHSRLGTANHLMIFGDNYFELIGVVEPNEFNTARREMLAKSGEGLANAALRTDSADVAHKAWTEAGLQPDAVLEFDREVEISGRKERAAFRTVRLGTKRAKLLGYFVCEHRTPQFVYRPEWAQHPNGVKALAGAVVIAEDPFLDEDYVTRVFGAKSVKREDGDLLVESGGTPIRFMTRARFEQHHPGVKPVRSDDHPALLRFAVTDPMATAALLSANGLGYSRPADGRIIVSAKDTTGVCVEFVKG